MPIAPKAVPQPSSLPARRGSLRTTPFADVLVKLLDARKTGTLRIVNEHGVSDTLVRLLEGVPVGARMPGSSASLMQTLIPLCSRADGDYVFVDDQDDVGTGEGAVLGRVDPVTLIAAAMRGPLREDVVSAAIDPLGAAPLRFNPRASLRRYAFTGQEQQVVDGLLQAPLSIAELCSLPGTNLRVVRRVVYVLLITRGLTPMVAARRMVSGTVERAQPPVSLSISPGRAQESMPPPARDGRYHMRNPDGGETAIEDTQQTVVRPMDARTARVVDAEAHRREAQRLLKQTDYPAAVREAHLALRADGTARNEALFAFLLYVSSGEAGRMHPRAFHHLDRALQREPNCEDAHFYKGLLLKRSGYEQDAAWHFRRVLKINPNNSDAVRELRLWESRRSSQSSSKLVARLFGQKPSPSIKPGKG